MQHEPLDYATPEPRGEPSIVALAALAPFGMLIVYSFGTIALHKFLDNGDPRAF